MLRSVSLNRMMGMLRLLDMRLVICALDSPLTDFRSV